MRAALTMMRTLEGKKKLEVDFKVVTSMHFIEFLNNALFIT